MFTRFLPLLALLLFAGHSQIQAQAKFSVSKPKIVAPDSIAFVNNTAKADAFEWDFGDGQVSMEKNPIHYYRHSGNYTVVLKAKKGRKTSQHKETIQVMAPERCLIQIETKFGTMLAELYNATPKHRDNFVKLAEEGYYNDLLFHRVINGFMIQGGDPNSRNAPAGQALGFGGPGYQVPGEFVDSLVHVKGAICAARTNNPEKASSGSQFYIVHGTPVKEEMLNQIENMRRFHYTPEQRQAYLTLGGTPHLDREYTVFGRVIEGLDIIDTIAAQQTATGDRPAEDVKMKVYVIK